MYLLQVWYQLAEPALERRARGRALQCLVAAQQMLDEIAMHLARIALAHERHGRLSDRAGHGTQSPIKVQEFRVVVLPDEGPYGPLDTADLLRIGHERHAAK